MGIGWRWRVIDGLLARIVDKRNEWEEEGMACGRDIKFGGAEKPSTANPSKSTKVVANDVMVSDGSMVGATIVALAGSRQLKFRDGRALC